MKFQEFKGDKAELTTRRGRADSPETVMIKEALEASATQGGKELEFVDMTKAELAKTKGRIPTIAMKFGYSYRMWPKENGLILSATFKEEKPKEEPKEEPKAEEKPTPKPAPPKSTATRRVSKKAVARA